MYTPIQKWNVKIEQERDYADDKIWNHETSVFILVCFVFLLLNLL